MKAMKEVYGPALSWAVGVALVGAIHWVCGRLLVDRDVVAAVIGGGDAMGVGAVVGLVLARLFLFLLAPGWGVYVVVNVVLARRAAAGKSGGG